MDSIPTCERCQKPNIASVSVMHTGVHYESCPITALTAGCSKYLCSVCANEWEQRLMKAEQTPGTVWFSLIEHKCRMNIFKEYVRRGATNTQEEDLKRYMELMKRMRELELQAIQVAETWILT